MAIDLLNLGTVADDRTGDTFRAGGTKVNSMFTELYEFKDAQSFVFVALESEFPVQDATTITLESKTVYVTSAAISTAKRFVVEDGAVITSFNIFGPVLEYTGTGSMFTGSDASFTIREIQISHPNAQGFSFTDTIGNTFLYVNDSVRTVSGAKYGTFNNMQTVFITGSSSLDMDDGVTFTGANQSLVSFNQFFMQSTSASFIGVDLGASIALTWEFTDLILVGPAGSIGIKGAASSANVTSGAVATVTGGNFSGIAIPLSGITRTDIRWRFQDNSGIRDTIIDALISLTANATATTIGTISTPVLVAGTWVVQDVSLMSGSTAGRATFLSEVDKRVPVSIVADVEPSSGTNKLIKLYLAKNGTIITESGRQVKADAANPLNVGLTWQLDLTTNDYLELYVENNTDTIDILVSGAVLRVN